MSKYKLHNVNKAVEKIAMAGLQFIMEGTNPNTRYETMTISKADLLLSQAEVAAMIVNHLIAAVDADEAELAMSIPNPSLN